MLLLLCLLLAMYQATDATDELTNALAAAEKALAAGQLDEALEAANRAVKLASADARAWSLRAAIHEKRGDLAAAIGDCDTLLKLEAIAGSKAAAAQVYDRRGSLEFKRARIDESIRDFDQAIRLDPGREAGHWKRGISYYYAGRYEEGQRQFEGYQAVDNADVENAVWRYLCMAKAHGPQEARRQLLKVGHDRRVPMSQIYALFAGKTRPDEVLPAAQGGEPSPEELKSRLFYAHLYLGLWHEAQGDRAPAREHLQLAANKYRIDHYMGDVARVHLELLKRPRS